MSDIDHLDKVSFDFEALDCCPSCENNILIPHDQIEWLDIDFWYQMCTECGLKFMNPRPTMQSYRDFYKNMFWQQKIRNKGFIKSGQLWNGGRYKYDNDKEWSPEFGRKNVVEKVKDLRFETISSALKNNITLNSKSKILEVGCGLAATLHEMKKVYDCETYAIEPSDEACNVIEKKGVVKLLGRYAEELNDVAEMPLKFDAIIFSHVLENTVAPANILAYAKRCLNSGGVIYIQTPNLYICDQMNPYHPYIFSNVSLQRIVESVGLKYTRISETIDRMLTVTCS